MMSASESNRNKKRPGAILSHSRRASPRRKGGGSGGAGGCGGWKLPLSDRLPGLPRSSLSATGSGRGPGMGSPNDATVLPRTVDFQAVQPVAVASPEVAPVDVGRKGRKTERGEKPAHP